MQITKLYDAIKIVVEKQAMSGEYIHSPHELTIDILNSVIISTLKSNQKSIVDCLGKIPKTTTQIATETGFKSKNISTQIRQITEKYPHIIKGNMDGFYLSI